jgi:hypothetical protein
MWQDPGKTIPKESRFMESRITIEYFAAGESPEDAREFLTFTDSDGKMKIPAENQIVTLPLEHPDEGPLEMQKDFRVVQVRYAFAGFVPNVTHQIVHILVTDLDE